MDEDDLIADEPEDANGSIIKALLLGTAVAVGFGLGGFFLVRDEVGAMGIVLFVLLPFATGLATSIVVRGKKVIIASLLMGAIICTGALIATKMEGWVCVLMSAPLIAIGLALGALIGFLIGTKILDKRQSQRTLSTLLILILPLFLVGANSAEEKTRRTPRELTVENRLVVEASAEAAWNQLKSIDKVSGTKGLLMKIGLPVPVSCSMEGEGVGAKRTCYFEEGQIDERVTEWNPPKSMKFEITKFDVPGRPWLSFKDASYDIVQESGQTVIIRKTTIISNLSPVFYWRPFEKLGVETEHEYLFEELKRRLDGVK